MSMLTGMGTGSDHPDIPPVLWILLASVILITAAVTLPSIIANARSFADAVQQQTSSPPHNQQPPQIRRALVRYDQNMLLPELTSVPAPASQDAATRYDQLLTALLSPPSLEELSQGYLTAIPRDTRYIGSRLVRGTLYIELSKAFFADHPLGDEGLQAALGQITETLRTAEQIQQYVLLFEGEIAFGPVRLR